eukprot:10523270-Ditylum_brightwellii.AAC.1
MADEQQAAVAHKMKLSATITAPKQHKSVITQLVNPVGDQTTLQNGLIKYAVELPREKSQQEPPAGAQTLHLVDDNQATKTGWTKVKHQINPSQNKYWMKTSNGMPTDNSNNELEIILGKTIKKEKQTQRNDSNPCTILR